MGGARGLKKKKTKYSNSAVGVCFLISAMKKQWQHEHVLCQYRLKLGSNDGRNGGLSIVACREQELW